MPTLSISDSSGFEGNSGVNNVTFIATLSEAAATDVTFDVTLTLDGTADASDFSVAIDGATIPVTIPAGATESVPIVVNAIIGDLDPEPNETFTITISNIAGADPGDLSATGTILNDDGAPVVPEISIAPTVANEGDSGTTSRSVFLFLSEPTTETVSFEILVTAPTTNALDANDVVTDMNGQVVTGSFAPGETQTTVTIAEVIGDTDVEPDESYDLTLQNVQGATIASGGGTTFFEVRNDDVLPPPSYSIDDPVVNEGDGTVDFTITRSGDVSQESEDLFVEFVDGSALNAEDWDVGLFLPFTFAANETTKVFTANVLDDQVVEPDETFSIQLKSVSGSTVLATGTATILNDDTAPPVISISDATVTEGDSGTTDLVFTVSLDKPATAPVSFLISFGSGSPDTADPSDFDPAQNFFPIGLIGVGETSTTVTFKVQGDTEIEAAETFTATLIEVLGATIGDGEGVGTILNDDFASGLPNLSIADSQVVESDAGFTPIRFTVSLDAAAGSDVTFDYEALVGAGDTAGTGDFEVKTGSATIPAGQTSVTVFTRVINETIVEPDETFTVEITNVVGANVVDGSATGTIIDNDANPLPVAQIFGFLGPEGDSGVTGFGVNIFLNKTSVSDVTGELVVTPGSPDPADDADVSGSLPLILPFTITAGSIFTGVSVDVLGDTVVEPDERLTVTIQNLSGAIWDESESSVTIVNDDTPPLPTISLIRPDTQVPDPLEGDSGDITPFVVELTRTPADGQSLNFESTIDVVLDLTSPALVQPAQLDDFVTDGTPNLGTVTFPATTDPGPQTISFTVQIAGDDVVEGPLGETFFVELANPTNAVINTVQFFDSGFIIDDDAPSLPVVSVLPPDPATIIEGDPPAQTTVNFIVQIDAVSTQDVTVDLQFAFGDTAPSDFQAVNAFQNPVTVTIPAGQTQALAPVIVKGDNAVEGDETFSATISNPINATLGTATASATIQDDDTAPTLPAISVSDVSVDEGNGNGTTLVPIVITLNQPSAQDVTFTLTVDADTADSSDVPGNLPLSYTRTIAAGQTSYNQNVSINADLFFEQDETLSLTLSNVTGATIGAGSAALTIVNDDIRNDLPTASIGDASILEGDSGITILEFPIALSAAHNNPVFFDVRLGAGTADGGLVSGDFVGDGSLYYATINAGETSGVLTAQILGDTDVEPDETFTATLVKATDPFLYEMPLGQAVATGTILNDDGAPPLPTISISEVNQAEGDAGATDFVFTVSLDAPATETVTFTAELGFDSGGAGVDADAADFVSVVPVNGLIVIGDTSTTVTFQVQGDTDVEADEIFSVGLSNIVGAQPGTTAGANLILNDDAAPPVISISDATVTEGDSGTTDLVFTVSLDKPATAPVSFLISFGSGSPDTADPSDFDPTQDFFPIGLIGVGETSTTVTYKVQGDTEIEPDETFTATLIEVLGATIGDGTGIGTILNDDGPPPLPNLSIADTQVVEADTGFTTIGFEVSLDTASGSDVTFDYEALVGAGDAASTGDFEVKTGSATIPAGQTSVTVFTRVINDTIVEPDETFTVEVSNVVGANVVDGSATGTIIDNDSDPLPVARVAGYVGPEGDTGVVDFKLRVFLTETSASDITGELVVTPGSPDPADDADINGGFPVTLPFTIPAGSIDVIVDLGVLGDTVVEPDERMDIAIQNLSGATWDTVEAAAIIIDDDAPTFSVPSVETGGVTRAEGDAGVTLFEYVVERLGDASGPASLDWQVVAASGDTADAADFGGAFPSGTVSFADGETSKSFMVGVSGDTDIESAEDFTVQFSNPVGATLPAIYETVGGTIVNDDQSFAITPLDAVKAEGDAGPTAFTFLITREGEAAAPVEVSWAASGSGGDPADAADFGGAMPSGSVVFDPGETQKTITLDVSGDLAIEADETFTVAITNIAVQPQQDDDGPGPVQNLAVQALVVGPTGPGAEGTILNDDSAPPLPVISISDATVTEGDSGTTDLVFTVSLDKPATAPVSFLISFGSGSPDTADPSDFDPAQDFFPIGLIGVGETSTTVTFKVQGDTEIEPDETFTATLIEVLGATIGDGIGIGTILNDDAPSPPPPPRIDVSINAENADKHEGDHGTTPFSFSVTRDGPLDGASSVDWTVEYGDTDERDFEGAVSGTVSFGPGERHKTVTIDIVSDEEVELDEAFHVTLSNPVNAEIARGHARGMIRNDDHESQNPPHQGGGDPHPQPSQHGSDQGELLRGSGGDDVIDAKGGNDTVYGANGNDWLLGGSGDDLLKGNGGNDHLRGEAGDDYLKGDAGDDVLDGGADDDLLQGGAGDDCYVFGKGFGTDRVLDFRPGETLIFTGAGLPSAAALLALFVDTAQGATLTLDDGSTLILEGVSKNSLTLDQIRVGAASHESPLHGEHENPPHEEHENPPHEEHENPPHEEHENPPHEEHETPSLQEPAHEANGPSDPTKVGSDQGETLRGDGGPDVIDARGGDDTVYGANGDDHLYGGAGDDVLKGNSGDDHVFGGAGDDLVKGDAGDDVLDGGADNDVLIGGAGIDTFLFRTGYGQDLIQDLREDETVAIETAAFASVEDLVDAFENGPDGAVLDLGGGDVLTLAGWNADALKAEMFELL